MLHYPRIGPHKPKPWVGGPGAPLNVAGPFLVTLVTFGIAPNYLSVPSPTVQMLTMTASASPGWGRFS